MPLKNYCEIEDIENYLLTEIDVAFESQVERWIEAMERHIDKETGRNFKADEESSVRKFDGDGEQDLFIDDCIEVEKIEVDGAEKEHWLYPSDELPYTKVILKDSVFTKGNQNIEITAKWGYSEDVPADIEFACTVLVAGIINRSLSHEGEVQSKTVGPYSVTFKTEKQWSDFEQIEGTLEKYKKYSF
ncbi:MAG: hypothetical protein ACKKMS_00125 [Candidatus Nealsonbacteria bacterium]